MNELLVLKAIFRGIRDGRLNAADCRLLAGVRLLEAIALIAVACAPIPSARKTLRKFLRPIMAMRGSIPESRVIWALKASARWRSGVSTCLARTLAAELLLTPGRPLTVVIGISAPVDGRLKSHAWLERDRDILIGGSESRDQYVPLISWKGGTA